MPRSFSFTLIVTDSQGRVVTTASGDTVVTDGRTTDQICQAIADDLPAHLRQPGYEHVIHLRQV